MGMDESEDIESQGAPATPEALRSIVARHQRARTRTLGIALAIALVAGPVAGWAVAQGGGGGGQRVASGGPAAPSRDANARIAAPVGGVAAFGPGFGGPDAPPAHHLFTRTTADGIVVRAYRTDPPAPASEGSTSTTTPAEKPAAGFACRGTVPGSPGKPPPPEAGVSSSPGEPGQTANASSASGSSASAVSGASASANASSPPTGATPAPPPPQCPIPPDCKPTSFVMAELSSEAAVGQGILPLNSENPSTPVSQLITGRFGVAESSPAMWVTVRTGPGVNAVRLRLPSGATDQMAPVEGVAVLAHGTPKAPPDGTVVEALDASGKVIGSEDVNKQNGPQKVTACAG